MNYEDVRRYYLSLPHVSESFPFDETTLVMKVGSRMFGYMPLDRGEDPSVCLKCDPDKAVELRERYDAVEPGYHMNKKHWNTVYLDRDLRPDDLLELVRHSYELVWSSLTKRERTTLLTTPSTTEHE